MIKLQCLTLDLAEAYAHVTVDLVVLVNQFLVCRTAALQINDHELNVSFLLDNKGEQKLQVLPAMM